MPLRQHAHLRQTRAAAPHEALDRRMLPRTAPGHHHLLDPHVLDALSQGNASTTCCTVHGAVGCSVLLQLEHAPPFMSQEHQHEEDLERHCWDDKAIQGNPVLHAVLHQGLPRRGEGFPGSRALLLHGRCRHRDAELPECSNDPGRSPRGMRLPQGADAVAHLLGNGGPARVPLLAQPSPGIAQPLALPGEDGTGLDKRQGVVPPPPQPGKPHPEEAIGRTKPPASDGLLLHSQLMLVRRHLELYAPACVAE